MSGLLNKLRHKNTATEHPIAGAPMAGGIQQQGAYQGRALNTSGGMQQVPTLQKSGGIMGAPLAGSGGIQQTTLPVTHQLAPIVQETVRQDRVVEVQPVLHREVDKNIVHHIEKHSVERAPSAGGVIEHAPVVDQRIQTNVVNEIQPIIHRERAVPVVERAEQHLQQHIVQPTIHTHEVIYDTAPANFGRPVGLPQPLGQQTLGQQTLGLQKNWGTYSGLNFPYSNAAAHPTYGYQRLPHNRKAERFELKAAEWERRGNMMKAQKNRTKAQRYRARSQPGWVAPVRSQDYYINRANTFDQKALMYQQWGMQPQYQRYQGRSQRIRAKHNIPWQQQGLNQGLAGQQTWQQGLGQQGLGLQQQGLAGQNLGLQQQGLGQNLGLQQQGLGQNLGLQQQGLQQNILQKPGLNAQGLPLYTQGIQTQGPR